MREDQILAAAVYVYRFAQVFYGHCGTFDVPAGASHSPGARPRGFARLLGFPQREVERVFLALAYLDSRPGAQVVRRLAAQFAVVVVAADAEIDVAARFVGAAAGDERGDYLDDLVHLARRARVLVGGQDVERVHRVHVLGYVLAREIRHLYAARVGGVYHLVVYVREVLDVQDVEAAEGEPAPNHVEGHGGHGVSYVRR